ncbi:MAG TPA: ABC transporter ATP-binding protein [Candidatus Gallacutalibacter pullicola]|uniref:ABC transporter ATP-binding protein n=1 Tax=Candidatus Gallacutalibacter pullicola TaxID=2840830 RepID=A0A9D1DQL0_9FIRM|nr:ABC transporter ATP-binding protein [Candidatus Gallacutalibacter pullicola]
MIELKGLTKKFGSFTALDSISFSVSDGSIFGLVGSNGAGKSTLLRTLAGVFRPDGGEALIDGQSPFENSEVKGKCVFISDYPYFFRQSTLSDMADFYRRIYRSWNPQRFDQLCGIFPIDRKKKIIEMSKGMQRQAALICALSTEPEYLFMDEIFDGLDPVIRQLLKRIVSGEVSDRNMTVIIASHNLRELEDLCDHVGLLHRGGILFERELDALKLGIHKVQAVFQPMPDPKDLGLDLVTWQIRGSLIELVARGSQEEILARLDGFRPTFAEALPLTLEEVFINEMEAAGYDIDNILV